MQNGLFKENTGISIEARKTAHSHWGGRYSQEDRIAEQRLNKIRTNSIGSYQAVMWTER